MALEVENLDVHYGRSSVIRGVSLQVDGGEIIAFLGRNGAGKTTTLKAMMGILRATQGSVRLDGQDITHISSHVRARMGLGYVPQGRLLFESLSVADNLAAVSRDGKVATDWVMEMFPVLAERSRQKAGTLSGGEQQMLAIARALVNRPRFLLMDEPSTGLMPTVLVPLKDAMVRLREEGIGILLVEEKVPFALELSTRGYILETGAIVHAGDRDSLRDEELLRKHLGVAVSSRRGTAGPERSDR